LAVAGLPICGRLDYSGMIAKWANFGLGRPSLLAGALLPKSPSLLALRRSMTSISSTYDELISPPIADAWFLTGPTASGKTRLGVMLAQRLGTEVLSLDSMAVFRGMDIGTAKPDRAAREAVTHHLLDLVDPTEEFSISRYVQEAHAHARRLRAAGKPILFVGGTPLYLKALLRGLFHGPPPDWDFRKQVEEEIAATGLDALRERLMQVDPLSATKLHPHDQRRMIRALEVYKLTGVPISHFQSHFDEGSAPERRRVFVLGWERPALHARIDARVEQMISVGLIQEVEGLLAKYGALGKTASQAVGYREVIEHLEKGTGHVECVDQIKFASHQFARRQEIWFRGIDECRRIEMAGYPDIEEIADFLVREGQAAQITA
jgi:tRNA dimethylallyltransferase